LLSINARKIITLTIKSFFNDLMVSVMIFLALMLSKMFFLG
jgi:hypothetical protein